MRANFGSLIRVLSALAVFALASFAGTATAGTGAPLPAVSITSGPATGTTANEASFEFRVTNPPLGVVQSLECSLDGAPAVSCSSPAMTSGLSVGSHSFKVTLASDPNSPKASATWVWTVAAADCPVGEVGTPPNCSAPPKSDLGKVKAKAPKKVRPGATFNLKAAIANRGEGDATGVQVCIKVPKRWFAGKVKRCQTIRQIPAATKRSAAFFLRVKVRPLPRTEKVTIKVFAPTGAAGTGGGGTGGSIPPVPLGMAINEKAACGPCGRPPKAIK